MKKYIYLISILFIAILVFSPVKIIASDELFFHISDTHVADDMGHVNQNSILTDWVTTTNNSPAQLTITTGDLAD